MPTLWAKICIYITRYIFDNAKRNKVYIQNSSNKLNSIYYTILY